MDANCSSAIPGQITSDPAKLFFFICCWRTKAEVIITGRPELCPSPWPGAPSTIGLWKAIPGYWEAFGIQSTSLPRAIIGPSPLSHLAIQAVGIPEIPYSIKSIANHIESLRAKGRNHALIVVAEAVKKEDGKKATVKFVDGEVRLGGIGNYLGDEIYKITDSETRVTVLGHVQRGAQPTHRDRLIASAFGVYAVDLIAKKKFNRVVVWKDRGVQDLMLSQVAGYSKTVQKNDPLIKVAEGLGIYIGETN